MFNSAIKCQAEPSNTHLLLSVSSTVTAYLVSETARNKFIAQSGSG